MKRNGKRALAALLAVLMAASSAPFAMAADTLPYIGESAKGENQPHQHGYRAEDFLDWSPETDPWGDMLRARVPLQDRNAALAATQAHPEFKSRPNRPHPLFHGFVSAALQRHTQN